MKELSIEEKARAYDEAFEKAKVLKECSTNMEVVRYMDELFLELKESKDEDEKIRKGLINYFNDFSLPTFGGLGPKKILAWLERQGEKSEEILVLKDQIESLHAAIKAIKETHRIELEKQGEKFTCEGTFVNVDDVREEFMQEVYRVLDADSTNDRANQIIDAFDSLPTVVIEKQGEQKSDVLSVPSKNLIHNIWFLGNLWKEAIKEGQNMENTELEYIQKHWREGEYYLRTKQKEHNLVDKTRPKFKVGDWIKHNKANFIFQINKVTTKKYEFNNHDGYNHSLSIKSVDEKYHLWTIQDAKDGDVLLSPSTPTGDKECPFIFKEIDKSGIVRYHAALLQSESFKIANGITNVMGYANAGYHTPATKEQRDLLFQKMKDAGYMWDADKKELKKIEQKPADIPEDFEKYVEHLLSLSDGEGHGGPAKVKEVSAELFKLAKLEQNHTWKPSEGQMEALRRAAFEPTKNWSEKLQSLYADLKKL